MNYKKVHCIGIGGIGLSALARYYKYNGAQVTGEDDFHGEVTSGLESENIKISYPISGESITPDTDLIVHTIAIKPEHPALIKAREMGVKIMTYPEALGEMTNQKRMISICGTHGKTTTTAMTFYALREAGIDAGMIVGSLIKHDGKVTNYVHGESEWIVVESCEYRRSFLNYNPEIILMTNIDNDHLDYFKDINETKKTFQEFVDKIKLGGVLISHVEYLEMLSIKDGISKITTNQNTENITLQVPGSHNRKNASLVISLGNFLKLDNKKIMEGLSKFPGTWRRQEYKGDFGSMKMYDDYAHHPTEVRVTIEAFKERYPNKKLTVTFQPHLYSRTKLLFDDFVSALSLSDEVLLLPIYAAREEIDETVNSEMLAEGINDNSENKNKARTFSDLNQLIDFVNNLEDKENTILLNLGAGDAYKMFEKLV